MAGPAHLEVPPPGGWNAARTRTLESVRYVAQHLSRPRLAPKLRLLFGLRTPHFSAAKPKQKVAKGRFDRR